MTVKVGNQKFLEISIPGESKETRTGALDDGGVWGTAADWIHRNGVWPRTDWGRARLRPTLWYTAISTGDNDANLECAKPQTTR